MLDTVTETAQRLAGEAYDAFEQIKRGDETITVLRNERPQWVYDAVYSAHSDFLPDDWRFDKIQDAFGAIHDASDDADLTEVGDEFADGAVDIYNHGRLQWLASNLNRPSYCDAARDEGLISEDADMVDRAGMGQYMEAREIWGAVVSALENACEEADDETDDDA